MQLINKTELIPFEWYCTVNDPQPKKKVLVQIYIKKKHELLPSTL